MPCTVAATVSRGGGWPMATCFTCSPIRPGSGTTPIAPAAKRFSAVAPCSIIFVWRWPPPAGKQSSRNTRVQTTTACPRSSSGGWNSSAVLNAPSPKRSVDAAPIGFPMPHASDWEVFAAALAASSTTAGRIDGIDDDTRPALADATRMTEQLRQRDSSYQAELEWWKGIATGRRYSAKALVSESEAQCVDVARDFPTSGDEFPARRTDRDHSKILVLSTYDDSRGNVLRCGQVLSTVLLECTVAQLATCTLTHSIEIDASRKSSAADRKIGEPQVLIRVGQAPPNEPPPPPTPRRPLADVLEESVDDSGLLTQQPTPNTNAPADDRKLYGERIARIVVGVISISERRGPRGIRHVRRRAGSQWGAGSRRSRCGSRCAHADS